jgi:hypothetical protein
MDPLWLLKGKHDAPGWKPLEKDAKDNAVDWRMFDRDGWVLIRAAEPPTQYEGLIPGEPPDGIYVDQQGNSVCLLGRQEVAGPEEVIEGLGDEGKAMLEKVGDAVRALERLGRAY